MDIVMDALLFAQRKETKYYKYFFYRKQQTASQSLKNIYAQYQRGLGFGDLTVTQIEADILECEF